MFKKRCFAIDSETQTIRAEKGSGATSASELIVWQSWQTLSSPNGLWFRTSPYSYRVPGFRSPFLFSIRHPVTVWVTDERNPRTTIYPSIFVWFFFVHFSKLTSLFLCVRRRCYIDRQRGRYCSSTAVSYMSSASQTIWRSTIGCTEKTMVVLCLCVSVWLVSLFPFLLLFFFSPFFFFLFVRLKTQRLVN